MKLGKIVYFTLMTFMFCFQRATLSMTYIDEKQNKKFVHVFDHISITDDHHAYYKKKMARYVTSERLYY